MWWRATAPTMAKRCVCVTYKLYIIVVALVLITVLNVIHVKPNLETRKPRTSHNRTDEFPSDIEPGVLKDVYYFWCGNSRMFEYRHYLSVLSVFLHLNPHRVRLFYENEPTSQELAYNTWLKDLREEYAFFSTAKLPEKWCADKQRSIDEYLSKHGGIYVQEEVILAGPLDKQWFTSIEIVRVVEDNTNEKLIQISRPQKNNLLNTSSKASTVSLPMKFISGESRLEDSRIKTGTVVKMTSLGIPLTNASDATRDKVILFKAVAYVVPEYFWELDSDAGRLLRTAAYGKPDLARPVQDFSRLAPNIAHVVWSNNDTMSFEFYLCVLSLLEVAKFDKVFLHGDGPPTGRYWDLIKNNPKLNLVHRTLIDGDKERVYGTEVKVRAHVVDVLRIDILNRYGGLYVDSDAIFFRPLTRELRAYDAVVSPDIAPGEKGFPNVYQNGIMLGKPGAKLWRLYLESMKKYYDDDWLWNCNFGLYRVKERHPETVLNYPRLNTICLNFICHPYWEPHMFHSSDGEKMEVMKHWQNNTFAIQNCFPSAPEHNSPEALLDNNGTTLFGAVGMYVLKKSGQIDFFRKLKKV